MEKSPIWIGTHDPQVGQTGVSLAKKEEHTRQRRALASGFTKTALAGQQDIIHRHVDKLIAKLRAMNAENQAIDFSSWCKSRRLCYEASLTNTKR
jgi:cytochrome P450